MHPQSAAPKEGAPWERFLPTHWSVVFAAGEQSTSLSSVGNALAELCRTYWPPLYGFIRSQGHSAHDAQDLTQSFFQHLIQHQIYRRADPARGKFRAFLLTSVKYFLANEYNRGRTLKRGGGCELLPLDGEQLQGAEALFLGSSAYGAQTTPDLLFEKQWAETLVEATLEGLAAEFERRGQGSLFGALRVLLEGGADPPPTYEELAGRLALPVPLVRTHVSRLRGRYRERLRAELRRTIGPGRASTTNCANC